MRMNVNKKIRKIKKNNIECDVKNILLHTGKMMSSRQEGEKYKNLKIKNE